MAIKSRGGVGSNQYGRKGSSKAKTPTGKAATALKGAVAASYQPTQLTDSEVLDTLSHVKDGQASGFVEGSSRPVNAGGWARERIFVFSGPRTDALKDQVGLHISSRHIYDNGDGTAQVTNYDYGIVHDPEKRTEGLNDAELAAFDEYDPNTWSPDCMWAMSKTSTGTTTWREDRQVWESDVKLEAVDANHLKDGGGSYAELRKVVAKAAAESGIR